jgi:hypothetical protein
MDLPVPRRHDLSHMRGPLGLHLAPVPVEHFDSGIHTGFFPSIPIVGAGSNRVRLAGTHSDVPNGWFEKYLAPLKSN